MTGYGEDLAYIQSTESGHSDRCAPGVMALLEQMNITDGLVVDLGCGDGNWARILNDAGYRVLGIDYSAPLVELARRRAPRSTFRKQSIVTAKIPKCDAVTAIGEIINYQFDRRNTKPRLISLFTRVFASLRPGGALIFDFAEPGRHPVPRQIFAEGEDWLYCADIREDNSKVTRRIITFRKIGDLYRRSEEIHRLTLYPASEVADELRAIGFRVRTLRGYGEFRFSDSYNAYAAIVARKPV